MKFEDYLMAKKIDASGFVRAEPALFNEWKHEFEQMHPNSFTMQKLNMINPVRRKYPLRDEPKKVAPDAPKAGRPVIKPKPKI